MIPKKLRIQKLSQKMDSILEKIKKIKNSSLLCDSLKLDKLKKKYKKVSDKRLKEKATLN